MYEIFNNTNPSQENILVKKKKLITMELKGMHLKLAFHY